MIFVGSLDLRKSLKVYTTDPCYLGQDLVNPPEIIDLGDYGWDNGTYPVFYENGRMILYGKNYTLVDLNGFDYDHHMFKKIGLTPVDSGQICFAVFPIKEDWDHENGSISDMVEYPNKVVAPVTDYDSCAFATIYPPHCGLSPLHRTDSDKGYVVVASTAHGDGRYPIFISENRQILIIETNDSDALLFFLAFTFRI